MKKNVFCLMIMSIASCSCLAQNCTDGTLLEKTGTWKEGLKGSSSGVVAADLAREKHILSTLHTMLKSSYVPMGVSADFSFAYNSPESAMPGNGYCYSIIPLNYFCEGGVIKTSHESSTYFTICANFFDADIYNAAQGDRASAEGYNVMIAMPVEKDGYYYFKEKDAALGFGMTGKSSKWLITYSGKLPYAYVNKKEFLEKRKELLADQMVQSASGFKDVLKNKEIEKSFKEKEYKNDPEKLNRYLKMDYLPIKERYEKLVADNEGTYEPALNKIETQLKMSATELSQPAIVKNDPHDHLSFLLTDSNDPMGKVLIKRNPSYFNTKLPRSSPQLFSVHIRGNPNDPMASKAMADIMKAVDFSTLKNMLGK
jgi:hypothetical protein